MSDTHPNLLFGLLFLAEMSYVNMLSLCADNKTKVSEFVLSYQSLSSTISNWVFTQPWHPSSDRSHNMQCASEYAIR